MGLMDSLLGFFSSGKLKINRRFDVIVELHSGEASRVVKVREKRTGEELALKIVNKKWLENYRVRFGKLDPPDEGRISLSLRHPNIIDVHEVGWTTDDEMYLLTEFLPGMDLGMVLKQRWSALNGKRMPLLRQAAEALKEVHDKGYIHRDVCPENFMVGLELDALKLLDFSVAVPNQKGYLQADSRSGRESYIAPELMRPQDADARIDVYAFGVTAYQLLTRRLPWEGDAGGTSIARALRSAADVKKFRPTIDPRLARALHSCLIPRPAERCASMGDFLDQIKEIETEDVPS